jgi:hypothetical protein
MTSATDCKTLAHSQENTVPGTDVIQKRKEDGELLYRIVRTNIQFGTTLKRQNLWNPWVQYAVIQDINEKL